MNKIRMLEWVIVTAALTALIAWVAPHQLGVTVYKLSLITTAAVLGYWIDRSLFPYARPDDLSVERGTEMAGAQIRRALVVAASIIGVALGA